MTKRKMQLYGWYPQRAKQCEKKIEELVSEYADYETDRSHGGVVPHAGWTFSGKLAGAVIKLLAENQPEPVDTVVIYGGHMGPEKVAPLMKDEGWETPFGDLELDVEFTAALESQVATIEEESYMVDNTMEIQLPFVKYYFGDVKIVGIRPPLSDLALEIGEAVHAIAGELERSICVIGSTDMTHYGPNYGFTPKGRAAQAIDWVKKENDKAAVELMLDCHAEKLIRHAANNKSACSAGAPAAVIETVRREGVSNGELVDYYTSYDVMPNESFVGYAGVLY